MPHVEESESVSRRFRAALRAQKQRDAAMKASARTDGIVRPPVRTGIPKSADRALPPTRSKSDQVLRLLENQQNDRFSEQKQTRENEPRPVIEAPEQRAFSDPADTEASQEKARQKQLQRTADSLQPPPGSRALGEESESEEEQETPDRGPESSLPPPAPRVTQEESEQPNEEEEEEEGEEQEEQQGPPNTPQKTLMQKGLGLFIFLIFPGLRSFPVQKLSARSRLGKKFLAAEDPEIEAKRIGMKGVFFKEIVKIGYTCIQPAIPFIFLAVLFMGVILATAKQFDLFHLF